MARNFGGSIQAYYREMDRSLNLGITGNKRAQAEGRCQRCVHYTKGLPGAPADWEACGEFKKWLTYPEAKRSCKKFSEKETVFTE